MAASGGLTLTVAGGLFSVLWEIRGDVKYTAGRVDTITREVRAAASPSPTPSYPVALRRDAIKPSN